MDELSRKAHDMIAHLQRHTHLSRELVALYFGRILMRISLGTLGVFLPIFFYKEYGYDLGMVIAIYISILSLPLLLLPLTTRLLGYLGIRRMIVIGVVASIFAIGSLYFFDFTPVLATLGYIFFNVLYRTLYWVPFHVDFSNNLDAHSRGRQLAILRNTADIILVMTPFIGGVLIASMGFNAVFLVSIAVMFASLFPLIYVQNTYERFSFGYIDTFMHLFARGNRTLLLAHGANGAQGVAVTVFWPIYVFILLDERFTAIGIIASLTIIAIIILRALIGNLFDRWSEKRVLVAGVILSTTGWIAKVFVQTPLQVFAADSYHNFGRTVNTLSFDAATYEQSADNGTFVDEYTVLKEMALAVGRILMLLLIAALLTFFDLRVAFIIAAVVALVMIVLNHKVSLK